MNLRRAQRCGVSPRYRISGPFGPPRRRDPGGHRNNYDCFAKSQTTPGTFVLDAHGFACGTCVSVALESEAMLAQGLSVKAIRRAIDAKWSSVGPATRTPLPD
jgi:hypothetical protein